MDKLLSLKKTSELLGVVPHTLREWDANGKLKSVRTEGGHRRYRESDIRALVGDKEDTIVSNVDAVATYGRVSSHDQKQKGDLDRQCQRLSEYCAKKKYTVSHILKDVGSGLSDCRTGLGRLFDLVIERKINKVIIENKDRLTRFQFNVFVKFFTSYDVAIECVESQETSDEAELTNDIMMLMAVFSGKIYGRRSAKRRKEKKNEDSKVKQV
jgi:putative resolvase